MPQKNATPTPEGTVAKVEKAVDGKKTYGTGAVLIGLIAYMGLGPNTPHDAPMSVTNISADDLAMMVGTGMLMAFRSAITKIVAALK